MYSGVYRHVKGYESEDEISEGRKQKGRPAYDSRLHVFLFALPWATTAVLSIACAFLLLNSSVNRASCYKLRDEASKDFAPAKSQIKEEVVVFKGGFRIHDNGTMYVPHPDMIKYVGEPSKEIDENWETLTWGRYFLITEEEAKGAWGDGIEQYWDAKLGGYVAGLDMFHTLHCVNRIRQFLYPEHYPEIVLRNDHEVHRNHCLEQIRQYVMCAGDLSPVPTKYYDGLGRNYVDSDIPHTCRNFGNIQKWMWDRYKASHPNEASPV